MLYDSDAERELYIIFHDDSKYPFSRFLKPGFLHCFALERQALGWLCIDPSRQDFMCTILPAGYMDDVTSKLREQNPTYNILHVVVMPLDNPVSRYPRPAMMSCVGVMQYVLGVYWPFVITPYQLYYKLLNKPPQHIEARIYGRHKESQAASQSSSGCKQSGSDSTTRTNTTNPTQSR